MSAANAPTQGRVKSQKEPVGAFEDELPKLSAGAQEKHTQLAEER